MIIVRLCGGLGNQLFQYAVGRALAHANSAQLVLDCGWFKNRPSSNTPRDYEFINYPVRARVATDLEEKLGRNYSDRILRRLPLLSRPWRLCREVGFDFNPNILKAGDDIYLDGYWQSYRYFNHLADTLRAELVPVPAPSPQDQVVLDSIDTTNSVSVHVRRGDYVTHKAAAIKHGVCSLDYYRIAIQTLESDVRDPHFFVFSDDPTWTREHLSFPGPATFVDHNGPNTAFQDLRMMSRCKHHVIANSTFSWWGAWLNPRKDKMVVAPRNWFSNGLAADDIAPLDWIRL
jgi:hypothetical protein